ncbi:glycosyl hydrolase family 28 protein [Phenylobacterium sp. LjRoot225]|uniref:glycosyl hydrolase family 28 protein n=1 Tax=Phenylobacterium sp. LjRoot225 TaxID=3342285 RepID=UPI003ED008B4
MIRRTSLIALAWLATGAAPAVAASPQLEVYSNPAPLQYSHHNDDFTVRVRQPGGAWRDLYEYDVEVDLDKPQHASMARFDFDGPVEVAIEKNNGDVRRVAVRPASAGVTPRLGKDGLVYLTLDRPANLSVEFDGDRLHNLHLLAGRPDEPPKPGPDVVVYEPGLHKPPADATYFPVRSNQTIYVAGGAVLQGQFRLDGVENVRIYGRGIIDRQQEQFLVHDSRNVTVEGLTFINSKYGTIACGGSKDVRFLDLKAFSAGQWSDGINVFACEGVTVDHAFIRTSDDSVAIYATRKDGTGDTRNVRVANSTFWPDVAHAMFVGLHGNTPAPNVIENVAFSNIDVLEVDEDDPEYEGVMAISAGDSNLVRHISFGDVRVEHIQEGKLFNVRVVFNGKYNTSPGKGVEDVVFRNISFTGAGAPSASLLSGYDAERRVRGVVFDNVTIAGRKLKAPEKGVLEVGPYADGVAFH